MALSYCEKSVCITQRNIIKSCRRILLFKLFSLVQNRKKKLQENERICNDHDSCFVEMPNEDNKILKYSYGEKSLKVPAIIYADLECLLEKMHSCQNNLEKSYTEKKTKHTSSGSSLFTSYSFDATKTWLLQKWRLHGMVL